MSNGILLENDNSTVLIKFEEINYVSFGKYKNKYEAILSLKNGDCHTVQFDSFVEYDKARKDFKKNILERACYNAK